MNPNPTAEELASIKSEIEVTTDRTFRRGDATPEELSGEWEDKLILRRWARWRIPLGLLRRARANRWLARPTAAVIRGGRKVLRRPI